MGYSHSISSAEGPRVGLLLNNVGKSFDQNVVLQDVNLEIKAGSFHVLIGPSGCGKTTLLRILGRLEMPSRGEVLFTQETSEGISEPMSKHFEGLSYGFQEPRLLPWLSVVQNIALPMTLKGTSSSIINKRVNTTLELVGLSEAAQLYPHQLSGGMKMRTAIARSLVSEPQVLLLDEPFGALDEITKNRLDDELYSLWKSLGMTVVLVTHSLTEAVYLGQHIHVLAANSGHVEGSIHVDLGERSPATRLTSEFTEVLAEAHSLLERAEGGA